MNEQKSLYSRVIKNIEDRRNRILSGKINCIPWGLPRFENESPGIEQGKYYLISANQKVGKSQITDWLFLYNAIQQVIDKGLNIKLKIYYFTLEMSKEQKMLSAFSNILYVKEGVRISPKDIRSTKADNVLSEEHLELIKKYEPYFDKIEEIVTFIDDVRNPFGIYKMLRDYALANGVQYKKQVEFIDNETGKPYLQEIDDYYEPNNPDEYVMIFIDHISLISTEKEDGRPLTLHESITKLSSKYLVQLRNKYNYIPVVIQQQAAASESLDHFKANKIKPSADTLAENKLTARDCDIMLGLFTPFRYEIPEYLGYDIKIFKDNIRFLEIVASRDGGAGTICPLYFDGAVNYFKELPLSKDKENINKVYKFLETIRK